MVLRAILWIALLGSALQFQANAAAPEFTVDTLVHGLDTPWAIDFAPDGTIFISERPGRIVSSSSAVFKPRHWMTLDYRVVLDGADARRAQVSSAIFFRRFVRLRDVVEGPDKKIYRLTSNHDGRGSPGPDHDCLLRIHVTP